MRILLITHPAFLPSQSMPRFAKWIGEGMQQRGHEVIRLSPAPVFHRLPVPASLKKWLGYIDQYLLFTGVLKSRIRRLKPDVVVFADNALGPFVPAAADRPHVVHCHDFLAQNSALGKIPENPTSKTGVMYQQYIRKGLGRARNFICISERTLQDLGELPGIQIGQAWIVYNGLTRKFTASDDLPALRQRINGWMKRYGHVHDLATGYLLHVGGNQWYKNRAGVVKLYDAWRKLNGTNALPLLLAGAPPSTSLVQAIAESPFKQDIHLVLGASDEEIRELYQAASLFVFPSLAEGFGWPIAEAMASGTPVITTNEKPMSEVGGPAAIYLDRMPRDRDEQAAWAFAGAGKIRETLALSQPERLALATAGSQYAERFNSDTALDAIEQVYRQLANTSTTQQ